MVDPWRFVDSDDDLVADFVAGTVDTVLELGGWLHPGLTIVGRDGRLRLEVDPSVGDDEVCVAIPNSAFVPISRVLWSSGDEALEVEGLVDELTAEQTQLLILQVALHNTCGKIPQIVSTHPALSPHIPDEVTKAVRAFRPSFRVAFPTPAELFWSNRVFRLPVAPGQVPEPVAVPIIDLLDHMHGGATAQLTHEGFSVGIRRPGNDVECFLDYGQRRDAIGMAVVYGFADMANPLAHSAPMTVDVPGVGIVEVLARGRRRTGELLAPIVTPTIHGFTVSRMTFSADGPHLLRSDLSTASPWSAAQVDAVIEAVRQRNETLALELHAAASEILTEPAGTTLSLAAQTYVKALCNSPAVG